MLDTEEFTLLSWWVWRYDQLEEVARYIKWKLLERAIFVGLEAVLPVTWCQRLQVAERGDAVDRVGRLLTEAAVELARWGSKHKFKPGWQEVEQAGAALVDEWRSSSAATALRAVLWETGGDVLLSWLLETRRWEGCYEQLHRAIEDLLQGLEAAPATQSDVHGDIGRVGLHPMPWLQEPPGLRACEVSEKRRD
jgi:hypothetical protein